MDAATKAERRRQGLEDSVDLSQDSTRVAKRAGRINTAPRNVYQDASGRRVTGPTSAQISAGRANPAFYANKERADKIAAAKSAGTFAQTRLDYNKANEGKTQMDDAGNITQVAKAPVEYEYGAGGMSRVKKSADETAKPAPSNGTSVPLSAFDKPSATASNQTPSKPEAPKKPGVMGPTMNVGTRRTPIQEQIEQAKQSLALKQAPAATQETYEDKVSRHAAEVGRKHKDLFESAGKIAMSRKLKKEREAKPQTAPTTSTQTAISPTAPASPPTPTSPKAPRPTGESLPQKAANVFGAAMNKVGDALKSLPKATIERERLSGYQAHALERARDSNTILSPFNPTQGVQGGKSSLADSLPEIAPPAGPDMYKRIKQDKEIATKLFNSGVITQRWDQNTGMNGATVTERAKLKFNKDGGRINPFKCGSKMKPMMLGGVVPSKVVPGAVLKNYAEGGEVEENNEVTMVGEEGPELMFKRKDGSMFVTPADVSAQIVDGITMEDTDENAEAMDAAKKRIKKTQVKPKMLGGAIRPNPFDTSNIEAAKKASMLPGGPDPMDVYRAEQWGVAQKQAAMTMSPSQQLAQTQGTALNGAGQPLNPFRKML